MVVLGLFVASLYPALSYAQEVAGLAGTVTDNSGGAVADATVKLVNTRTGNHYEMKTNATGYYRLVQLAPGPGYDLTISKDGFKLSTVANLYLPVATTRTQDVLLEVGTVTQTVEVKSEGSVSLDTTDVTIGNNFDMRAVATLPNQFRDNPGNLLRLQPAVVSAGGGPTDDNAASRDGSVAGARADQDNITVDGIDAADFGVGAPFSLVSPIPVDAIQEFRTEVANPLAQSGRGSGAQTIITTKSGSNDWHGSAREYHRNTATEANSFFNNAAGVERPKLIRNQFGGNIGGPVFKDKLFFFFDYDGRRDASQSQVTAFVPLDNVKNFDPVTLQPLDPSKPSGVAYVNNGPGCTPSATIQSAPNCISYASPQELAALDPCSHGTADGPCTITGNPGDTPVQPGFAPGLQKLFQSRYPAANDVAAGDGLNSGVFRFNAPNPVVENTYTARLDFNLSSKHKLFGRFNFNNVNDIVPTLPSIQFPGDPITNPRINRGRSWALGDTWTISSTKVNQFVYGETRADFSATVPFNPTGAVFQLNWLLATPISSPYARPSGQAAINPIPTFRDDFSWSHGRHQWQFGGLWKPIRTRSKNINDLEFVNSGIGITQQSLDPSLRPANILSDPAIDPNGIATSTWDAYYTAFVGAQSEQINLYNFTKDGTALPSLTGSRRDYRYYEYEGYVQDTWKIRPNLTATIGLRYQYDSVPYETNGLQAVATGTDLASMIAARIANGNAGVSGYLSSPLLTYVLAGKANHGPAFYAGDKKNFSPRLGLAWNPNYHDSLLGSVLGEHKTVLRAGFGLIYDHNALSAVNFAQDQSSYLFQGLSFGAVGGNTAEQFLASTPRFTDATVAPFALAPPPPSTPPFIPNSFTDSSGNLIVDGSSQGQFGNYGIDPHFKTPYALTYSAGMQRELPGSFQLEIDYFGRFGRRLLSLADSGQLFNFVDPASKTGLINSLTSLELSARQQADPTTLAAIPFFENQGTAALQSQGVIGPGQTCAVYAASLGFNNCTQVIYANNGTALSQGNLVGVMTSVIQAPISLLSPGVGLSPQFQSNYYLSNKGYSAYNSMLLSLRKRLSHNLQMDFNYTFSHSIDDFSAVANNNGNPFVNAISVVCDVTNLNVCKGNSEFDITHSINANAIYDLPFGHGQRIGHDVPGWANEIIGGWQVAGLTAWHTGFAFPVTSGVTTTSFGSDALAIFNGNNSALGVNVHTDSSGAIQLFRDPVAAKAAFSNPIGQEVGNRDILRGPSFSNWDLAVAKYFPLFGEKYKLQFRAEAYNAFNHPTFSLPGNANINSSSFGRITTNASDPRVLQFALRFDF
jgi:Carboxypeptidase regulatory-like domain/TonB dependent receptor